jgi:hypothetical protein
VAPREPVDDQVDQRLVIEDDVDLSEGGIPEFVTVRQQHLEDPALCMGATDHGASMETKPLRTLRVRVYVANIARHDGASSSRSSRKLRVRTGAGNARPHEQRASVTHSAP